MSAMRRRREIYKQFLLADFAADGDTGEDHCKSNARGRKLCYRESWLRYHRSSGASPINSPPATRVLLWLPLLTDKG